MSRSGLSVVVDSADEAKNTAGRARRGRRLPHFSSVRRRAIPDARSLHHQRAAQRGGWVAGTHLAGEARTPLPTRRGASWLCRVLMMQAAFLAASVGMRDQLSTAMMLSAHCCAVRENRRNFYWLGASRHESCRCLVLRRRSERLGDRVLPRATPRPLVSHDDAGNEQLSTPDAPRLTPLQRASQARLSNRAVQAQCLCLLDIGRCLSEEQIRIHQSTGQFGDAPGNDHRATSCVIHVGLLF